jgi:hypothetical protein
MEGTMSRALRLGFVAILVAIAGSAGAQLPPATTPPVTEPAQTIPTGRTVWRSEDGSTLELTIDATAGTLTGTFAPGFPCGLPSTLSPATRPIAGTVNGNAVAWTLSLPACPSVGTWIGHYRTVETVEQLTVLWTLALPEFPPGVGSTLTGSTVFVRQTGR